MEHNRLSYYDRATRELIKRAERYGNITVGRYCLPYAVAALREAFKHQLTYTKVFGGELFRKYYNSQTDPAQDYCLISSYYIYLRTGADNVWNLKTAGGIHTWLQAKGDKQPSDITFTQFVNSSQYECMTYDYFIKQFPYNMGQIDTRMKTDRNFEKHLMQCANILGKCAGLE